MFLKCGHASVSDTYPLCAICPYPHWDPPTDPDSLPSRQWAEPTDFPITIEWRCAVCGNVSDKPLLLPELHADGYHIHYCGCRSREFDDILMEIL